MENVIAAIIIIIIITIIIALFFSLFLKLLLYQCSSVHLKRRIERCYLLSKEN